MSEDYRYTYSKKTKDGEMFVVRSNDFGELLDGRNEITETLSLEEGFPGDEPKEPTEPQGEAPRTKRPYKHPGDRCPECNGTLQIKDGENSTTKQPFRFLGCSNFPACSYTAYISKFAKKVKA